MIYYIDMNYAPVLNGKGDALIAFSAINASVR